MATRGTSKEKAAEVTGDSKPAGGPPRWTYVAGALVAIGVLALMIISVSLKTNSPAPRDVVASAPPARGSDGVGGGGGESVITPGDIDIRWGLLRCH